MYGRMRWTRSRHLPRPRRGVGYSWRKETIERSFAEAKENHGLRYARMLGRDNMREQSFLTAAVQNMKRLAKAFFVSLSLLLIALIKTATLRLSRNVAVC